MSQIFPTPSFCISKFRTYLYFSYKHKITCFRSMCCQLLRKSVRKFSLEALKLDMNLLRAAIALESSYRQITYLKGDHSSATFTKWALWPDTSRVAFSNVITRPSPKVQWVLLGKKQIDTCVTLKAALQAMEVDYRFPYIVGIGCFNSFSCPILKLLLPPLVHKEDPHFGYLNFYHVTTVLQTMPTSLIAISYWFSTKAGFVVKFFTRNPVRWGYNRFWAVVMDARLYA